MHRTYQFVIDLSDENLLQLDLQLRQDELAAIGEISAQWACLEFHIMSFIKFTCSNILNEEPPQNLESDSFRKRKKVWKSITERALVDALEDRQSMLNIIETAGSLQGERQLAIHSYFQFDEHNQSRLLAYSPKASSKGFSTFDINRLKKISAKIANLNARFLAWPDEFPEMFPSNRRRS